MPSDLASSDGEELVVAASFECGSCGFWELDTISDTWTKKEYAGDTALEELRTTRQGPGVHASSERYVLGAFGTKFENGRIVEARTAVLLDRDLGTLSIEEPPEGFRAGGSRATVHWTGREFLIFGGRAPVPMGASQDFLATRYYDGILFEPSERRWTLLPPARPDATYRLATGGPSLASVWTSAGLFVWGTTPERNGNWGAVFDLESMSWEILEIGSDAPPVMQDGQLVTVGDEVFLFSGRPVEHAPGTFARWLWRYSLTSRTWTKIEVPTWADPLNGTVVRGRLAFTGRCAGGDLYDPTSDTWQPLASQGAPPSTGVPRGAGSFLTVTDTYYAEQETNEVWILDLREVVGP